MLGGCASTHVLRDFSTDRCSLFPDGDAKDPQRWASCCVKHDMAYWRGGAAELRQGADSELRQCVLARTGRPALANLMYRGVRLGGTPLLPAGFRWGYGWGYGRGYELLTPEEQRLADQKLAAYLRAHPESSCDPQ
jgi:hypothetical protein